MSEPLRLSQPCPQKEAEFRVLEFPNLLFPTAFSHNWSTTDHSQIVAPSAALRRQRCPQGALGAAAETAEGLVKRWEQGFDLWFLLGGE